METENALTIAKENSKENFFEEEARLWAEVYGKQSDKPDLESLQRMLENMNCVVRTKIQIIGKPTNCLPNSWTLLFTCHRTLT